MLTAHLPSGYLIAHHMPPKAIPTSSTICAAIAGSLLPDFDMLAFYFLDHGSFHHRYYWTHIPSFWLITFLLILSVLGMTHAQDRFPGISKIFSLLFCGVLGHLLVDTWSGPVMWLYPFSTTIFELIEVPASRSHWVLSYLLHWSIAGEAALWLAATWIFLRQWKRGHT